MEARGIEARGITEDPLKDLMRGMDRKSRALKALQHYVQDEAITFDAMLKESGCKPFLKQLGKLKESQGI